MIVAINESGCTVEFLPPYSPDLNPIKKKWLQAKAIRRQHLCAVDELFAVHLQYVGLGWLYNINQLML